MEMKGRKQSVQHFLALMDVYSYGYDTGYEDAKKDSEQRMEWVWFEDKALPSHTPLLVSWLGDTGPRRYVVTECIKDALYSMENGCLFMNLRDGYALKTFKWCPLPDALRFGVMREVDDENED